MATADGGAAADAAVLPTLEAAPGAADGREGADGGAPTLPAAADGADDAGEVAPAAAPPPDAGEAQQLCPICGAAFPAAEIEDHANRCLDGMMVAADAEVARGLDAGRARGGPGTAGAVDDEAPPRAQDLDAVLRDGVRRTRSTSDMSRPSTPDSLPGGAVEPDDIDARLDELVRGLDVTHGMTPGAAASSFSVSGGSGGARPLPAIGSIVVRGDDWQWHDQDRQRRGTPEDSVQCSHLRHEGRVTKHVSWSGTPNTAVHVRWAAGGRNTYRYGAVVDGRPRYDVRVVRDEYGATVDGDVVSYRGTGGTGQPPPPMRGVLYAKVIRAQGIPSSGLLASSTVVRGVFEEERQVTPTARFTSEPEWNKEFVWRVREFYGPSTVRFSLCKREAFSEGDDLGVVEVALSEINRPAPGFEDLTDPGSRHDSEPPSPESVGVADGSGASDGTGAAAATTVPGTVTPKSDDDKDGGEALPGIPRRNPGNEGGWIVFDESTGTDQPVGSLVRALNEKAVREHNRLEAERRRQRTDHGIPQAERGMILATAAGSMRISSGINPLPQRPVTQRSVKGGGAVVTDGEDQDPEAVLRRFLEVRLSVNEADADPWIHRRWLPLKTVTGKATGASLLVEMAFISEANAVRGTGPLHRTPLHWAALGGRVRLARELAEFLSVSNPRGADGVQALDLAAMGPTKDHEMTFAQIGRFLTANVSKSFTASTTGNRGRNTLHFAVLGGHESIAKAVRTKCPSLVTQKDAYGLTPFALACALGREKIAKSLVGESASALGTARERGRGRVVHGRWILGPVPEMLAATSNGDTPLLLSCRQPRPSLVKFLIALGAQVHHQNSLGNTCLHVLAIGALDNSCGRSSSEYSPSDARACVRILLEAGAHFPLNSSGNSPLHIAVASADLSFVKELVGNSKFTPPSVFSMADAHGHTALDIVSEEIKKQTDGDRVASLKAIQSFLEDCKRKAPSITSAVPVARPGTNIPSMAPTLTSESSVGGEWADDEEYDYETDSDPAEGVGTAPAEEAGGAGESKAAVEELESKEAHATKEAEREVEPAETGPDPDEVPGWFCEVCTLLNSPWTETCIMCESNNSHVARQCLADIAERASKLSRLPGDTAGLKVADGGSQGSDDDAAGASMPPTLPPGLGRQVSHEVMDSDLLAEEKMRLLTEASAALRVPVRVAGLLLLKCKWDANTLVEQYVEKGDRLLEEAGISRDDRVADPDRDPDEEVECPACFDDFPASKMFSLACGHEFCKDCWEGHLAEGIKEGPVCLDATTCPTGRDECTEVVDERSWKELADEETFATYNRFLLRSFIGLQPNMLWCPNPSGCDRIVKYSGTRADLQCSCGYRFCFNCGLEAHSPASCDEYTMWKDAVSAKMDISSVKTMMDKFKRCPKCKIFIDKNSGCKHMTCTNPSCRHEFCWNCKAVWPGYSHRCIGYSDATPMSAKKWNEGETTDKERAAMDTKGADGVLKDATRFAFHFTRVSTQDTAMDQIEGRLSKLGVTIGGVKKRTNDEEEAAGAAGGAGGPAGGQPGPRRTPNPELDARAANWRGAHGLGWRGPVGAEALATAFKEKACSYMAVGGRRVRQPWYHCRSCNLRGNLGMCLSCVSLCHRGHEVSFEGFEERVCRCADSTTSSKCQCCDLPSAPELQKALSNTLEDAIPPGILELMGRPPRTMRRGTTTPAEKRKVEEEKAAAEAEAAAAEKLEWSGSGGYERQLNDLRLALANLWTFHVSWAARLVLFPCFA